MAEDISERYLTREERIKRHSARIEVEEKVEEIKHSVDTHLSPDEIKSRLVDIRKKMGEVKAAMAAHDDPVFVELKEELDIAVSKMRGLTVEHASAVTELFKLDQKYGDQIRKLEQQLVELKEKRRREGELFERRKHEIILTRTPLLKAMRGTAAKMIQYCREKGIDPKKHIEEMKNLDVPEPWRAKNPVKTPSEKLGLPLSWFNPDIKKKWMYWKTWLGERGVVIRADASGIEMHKELNGEEAYQALRHCYVKYSRDAIGA